MEAMSSITYAVNNRKTRLIRSVCGCVCLVSRGQKGKISPDKIRF